MHTTPRPRRRLWPRPALVTLALAASCAGPLDAPSSGAPGSGSTASVAQAIDPSAVVGGETGAMFRWMSEAGYVVATTRIEQVPDYATSASTCEQPWVYYGFGDGCGDDLSRAPTDMEIGLSFQHGTPTLRRRWRPYMRVRSTLYYAPEALTVEVGSTVTLEAEVHSRIPNTPGRVQMTLQRDGVDGSPVTVVFEDPGTHAMVDGYDLDVQPEDMHIRFVAGIAIASAYDGHAFDRLGPVHLRDMALGSVGTGPDGVWDESMNWTGMSPSGKLCGTVLLPDGGVDVRDLGGGDLDVTLFPTGAAPPTPWTPGGAGEGVCTGGDGGAGGGGGSDGGNGGGDASRGGGSDAGRGGGGGNDGGSGSGSGGSDGGAGDGGGGHGGGGGCLRSTVAPGATGGAARGAVLALLGLAGVARRRRGRGSPPS